MKKLITNIDLHHLIVIFTMAGLAKYCAEHLGGWSMPLVFIIGYFCGKITAFMKHK